MKKPDHFYTTLDHLERAFAALQGIDLSGVDTAAISGIGTAQGHIRGALSSLVDAGVDGARESFEATRKVGD